MRLLITFCLGAVLSLGLQAQTDKEAIGTMLDDYFSLIGDKKISEALDHVHPELIGMVGKEMFEAQYKQLFNSPGIEVTMDTFSKDGMSDTFKKEEDKYVMVDYSFVMTFKVDMSNDKEGTLGPFLLGTYKQQFGEENVTSPENGTYVIKAKREMFAVSKTTFDGWRILDYEPGMKMMLGTIIPSEVFEHFKK